MRVIKATLLMLCLALSAACPGKPNGPVQGYVEGEYLYMASELSGTLLELDVSRGSQVRAGGLLYVLDDTPERTSRDEAAQRVSEAHSSLEDIKKGLRPTEIASLEAQLKQADAALVLSEKEFTRQEALARAGYNAAQDVDVARSARDQGRERVAQIESDLKTARLGARTDQVAAGAASERSFKAAEEHAEYDLSQSRQSAPQDALVFDTLYRPGEWVAAGRPVVMLLPPANIKVRAFVPEPRIAALRVGETVRVGTDGIDGKGERISGKVSFISPSAEYTPPVIYSRETRSKLVFMIEVVFSPEVAARMHPGQPVDVYLP